MISTNDGGLEQLARQLLDRQAESRSLDFKAPMSFGPNKADKGGVLKWIMAFANTRDGGYVLVGVEQIGGRFVPVGVTEDQAESFDPTRIATFAGNYCSVLPRVTVHVVEIDKISLLLLRVNEFDEEPVICTKDLHEAENLILRAGSIYVRTDGARSMPIESGATMRAFLDLAVEKRGGALLQQIRRLMSVSEPNRIIDPTEAYAHEIEAAYTFYDRENLKDSYWFLELMPATYEHDRVASNARLKEIRRESVVSIRGWDFPHVDREYDRAFDRGIESVTHWARFHEAHRVYRSGLFTWRSKLHEDYSDQDVGSIDYESSIYTLTELFIFASRYAPLIAEASNFALRVGATGLGGRVLRSGPGVLREEYKTGAYQFDRAYQLSLDKLRASHLELAAEAAQELFELYNLDISLEVISNWQKRFIERG